MKTSPLLLAASLICSLTQLTARNLDPAKPNVIFLYYDDMGFSDMGIYRTDSNGNPPDPDSLPDSLTPNLDAFASDAYASQQDILPMPFALLPVMRI